MQKIISKNLKDTLYLRNVPIFTYNIQFPAFTTSCTTTAACAINCYYNRLAKKSETQARTTLYSRALENAQYIPSSPPPFNPYVFQSDYKITYNWGCTTSLYFDNYTYLGGAHGSTQRISQTWDFRTGCRMTLRNFFPCCTNYVEFLYESIEMQIAARLDESPSSYFDDYKQLLRKTFRPENFYLTSNGLVIYYQQYDIAPYATGITEFLLPF